MARRMPVTRRATLAVTALAAALIAFAASASAHPFTWDGKAADPKRPGVTLRWDRTLSSCGDTSPFRTMKVKTHQGQTDNGGRPVPRGDRAAPDQGAAGQWFSLPSSSDTVTKRAPNGRAIAHSTLQFYLRFVDRGKRSRVQLRFAWMQVAGDPGDADDKLWARRTVYTGACTIP